MANNNTQRPKDSAWSRFFGNVESRLESARRKDAARPKTSLFKRVGNIYWASLVVVPLLLLSPLGNYLRESHKREVNKDRMEKFQDRKTHTFSPAEKKENENIVKRQKQRRQERLNHGEQEANPSGTYKSQAPATISDEQALSGETTVRHETSQKKDYNYMKHFNENKNDAVKATGTQKADTAKLKVSKGIKL